MSTISTERLREIAAYQPLDFAITHAELTGMARELLSLRSQPEDGWQDISTAPKDGSFIIGAWSVNNRGEEWIYGVVKWDEGSWIENYDPVSAPAHWRPLPPSPGASL